MKKMFRRMVRKAMKALINLDYRINPDRDELISIGLGTKYDDHDFTLIVNRYGA